MSRRPMRMCQTLSATSASSRRPRSTKGSRGSPNGIVIITRFEGGLHGLAYHSTDHVWRRRNAPVARLARGTPETVPAAVRQALDLPGDIAEGIGRRAV